MSHGARYHIVHKTKNGPTYRVELLEDGYGGASTRKLAGDDIFTLEYESLSPKDVYARPIQKSNLILHLLLEDKSDISIVEDLFGAEDDTYRLRLKVDGSTYWEGAVVTDLLDYSEGELPSTTQIVAKDLSVLEGNDYTLKTDRKKLITIIADILADTGLGLGIKTSTSWTHADITDADDFLDQIWADRQAIRDWAEEEGESDQPYGKFEVLETICKNFGLILRQQDGYWWITQLTQQANDPITVYEYNSSGVLQSSSSVDVDAPVNKLDRWLLPGGRNIGLGGIKTARVIYEHRGKAKNINYEPRITIQDSDPIVYNEATLMPFWSSGEEHIELSFGVIARATGDEVSASIEVEIRAGDTGNYSYLNSSGAWQDSSATYTVDLGDFDDNDDINNPDIQGPGDNTINSSGSLARQVFIQTDDIPVDADGSIRVRLYGAKGLLPNDVENYLPETRYFNINFDLVAGDEEGNSQTLEFTRTQSGNFSKEVDLGVTWYGDGPSQLAPGALSTAVGSGFTQSKWRRTGGTAELALHELLLREILDTQRDYKQSKRAQLLGDYKTQQILTTDSGSKRYFFLSGQLSGRRSQWDGYLFRVTVDTAGDDTIGVIINEPDGGGPSGGGGGGNDPEPPESIGEITDDLSGTYSSDPDHIPVEVYTGESIESGKDYFIWNNVKKAPVSFTALETLDAGKFNLDIEEQVIVAKSGSKIYKEEGQKETERIIQVQQQTETATATASLSLSVKNERQATSLGTTVNEVSGTATSIALESIPFQVKVEDGDRLTILSTEDADEGANEEIVVDGDQTLTSGTGTLSINSVALSNTYPAGSAVFEPAAGLTSRITLASEVTTSNSSSIASLETDVTALESTLVLKAEVTSGEITKLAYIQLDASIAGGSAITLAADQINISGNTTFTNGYDPSDGRTTIRQNTAPTARPSGDDLKVGDIWLDTDDGDKPYSWNGTSWIAEYTNIDGGSIVTGAIESGNFVTGSSGWQIDTNGDAEFNTVTIRDGTIINPTFSGAAVGLINTVSTFANLPASGAEDGDTYYVEDEPGGLYVWRSADSEWKDTRNGQFILADSISASKIQVATLSAITADIGVANISNTLTMGASGEITNSAGDYSLTDTGLHFAAGTDSTYIKERAVSFGDTPTDPEAHIALKQFVNPALVIDADSTIVMDAAVEITIRGSIVKVEDGLQVSGATAEMQNGLNVSGGNAIVPNSTTGTHALNVNTADGRYLNDGTVSDGALSGTADLTVRLTVDGQQVDMPAYSV